MIKVGVIGVGYLGAHHARIFSELKDVQLIGVVDANSESAREVASRYSCKAYENHLEIMDSVDAVSIATPTTIHFPIAMDFLMARKDILIEKPITSNVKEAEELIHEAQARGLVLQVGHLERFNPGLSIIDSMLDNPSFIESHRLSPFSVRGTDVDVTLDLMIHDIDIILSLVGSEVSDLRATGDRVLTENIDTAHAWIEFENGCIAGIVASRISPEKVRQIKVFQRHTCLSLDYQSQEVLCYRKVADRIETEKIKPEKKEPLREQLKSFIKCVRERSMPVVSGVEGKKALEVALKISEVVKNGKKY
ncbi:MAG TPA: UDP-N-acetyl-D-glucosamine dehydrogenase [Nitrospiraceae bacterium]|nr:UDP-N-acetyl-D-glucosamine dehydrogenase [Nitrospiraceae bacterium]